MAIYSGTLINAPSDLAKLANDGRIDLTSATGIQWGGSVIGLWDGSAWAVCKPSSAPSAINTSTDLNGTALAVDKVYDVFMNYTNTTACSLAFSRWAAHTAGSSARNAAYAAGTAYAIGDRVTSGGKDYTCIQAGTGQTPSSSPTYWVDNGTSVTGDFAGLYRHDGVLVSHNSDAGKKLRWLGVIYTYNNSSTVNFKDEATKRYISNYYNRTIKPMEAWANGAGATTSSTAWEICTGATSPFLISPQATTQIATGMCGGAYGNNSSSALNYLGVSVNGTHTLTQTQSQTGSYVMEELVFPYFTMPAGLCAVDPKRKVTAGTATQWNVRVTIIMQG